MIRVAMERSEVAWFQREKWFAIVPIFVSFCWQGWGLTFGVGFLGMSQYPVCGGAAGSGLFTELQEEGLAPPSRANAAEVCLRQVMKQEVEK